MLIGIYCWKNNNENARIYILATAIFFIGEMLKVSRVFSIEEASIFTEYGMQIGILLEMTILSLALGNRINAIKLHEAKEKALIRSRIASDLHDEIGSNLSSISVSSQMIKMSPNLNGSEIKQLEDISITAKETADSIRDIIWFINPEYDRIGDLLFKMKETAAKLLSGKEYEFSIVGEGMLHLKNIHYRKNLFLMFKEMINNVVKHSNCKRVKIICENNSEEFRLIIDDDGIGFDVKNVKYGEGIKNLMNRANELGGFIDIKSKPGKGTTTELLIKK